MKKSSCIAALAMAFAGTAAATDFVVMKVRLDQVMQPKNVIQAVQDCSSSDVCKTLVDAAATYLGAPPGTVSAAMASIPGPQYSGEDANFRYNVPSGYQYCRALIRTISVTPASGDRASVMSAGNDKNGVHAYTWTPRQGLGGGRSWVEAEFTIYGVRNEIADQMRAKGTCRAFGKPLINCRGAKGVNKGMPACGQASD